MINTVTISRECATYLYQWAKEFGFDKKTLDGLAAALASPSPSQGLREALEEIKALTERNGPLWVWKSGHAAKQVRKIIDAALLAFTPEPIPAKADDGWVWVDEAHGVDCKTWIDGKGALVVAYRRPVVDDTEPYEPPPEPPSTWVRVDKAHPLPDDLTWGDETLEHHAYCKSPRVVAYRRRSQE